MTDKEFVKSRYPKAVVVKSIQGKGIFKQIHFYIKEAKDNQEVISFGLTADNAWKNAKKIIENERTV